MDIKGKELGSGTDFCVERGCLEHQSEEEAAFEDHSRTKGRIDNFRAAFGYVARQKETARVACKRGTMVPVTTSLTSSSCHSGGTLALEAGGTAVLILFSNYMKCGERILETETQLCPLTVQTQ